ncbi:MAG: 5-formyltetrahydrofolate cyclo-ligase [Wenzhouxiangellaceae bacterium]|nr:5-formyltetrahydrofolate cyclo-ligase [Wenzhouxiangellaceae bacterium]
MTEPTTRQKAELRSRLIESRTLLQPQLRRHANRRICAHLLRLVDERDCLDIAAFLPFRGEPDLVPALEALSEGGRRIWLPVVDDKAMRFHRWQPGQQLRTNRFGIPEPTNPSECDPEDLELVLLPLVAFSGAGTRLGLGAGFYDRTFGFTCDSPEARPQMIGAAYTLQEVDSLPRDPWDVPLDGVITERGLQIFGA